MESNADIGVRYNPQGTSEPVDAAALLTTLDGSISPATLAAIEQSDPRLRAALVLGSPDFMRY